MMKLYDTLTLAQVERLIEKTDAARDAELTELQLISNAKERALKANHGIFGRLGLAQSWMEEITRAVVADEDTPMIKLKESVVVTLWDAHIEVD